MWTKRNICIPRLLSFPFWRWHVWGNLAEEKLTIIQLSWLLWSCKQLLWCMSDIIYSIYDAHYLTYFSTSISIVQVIQVLGTGSYESHVSSTFTQRPSIAFFFYYNYWAMEHDVVYVIENIVSYMQQYN